VLIKLKKQLVLLLLRRETKCGNWKCEHELLRSIHKRTEGTTKLIEPEKERMIVRVHNRKRLREMQGFRKSKRQRKSRFRDRSLP
jgi:hypothetical protein